LPVLVVISAVLCHKLDLSPPGYQGLPWRRG
jgi:hypothetical protein